MKRFTRTAAIILALVLLLGCLAACGKSLSSEEQAAVGRYEMTSVAGVPYESENSYLVLNDNGKADLYVEGEGGTVNWSLVDGTLTVEDSEGSFTGTVDGSVVTLDIDGIETVFERAE